MELLKKTDTFFLRTMNEQYERFITKYLFVFAFNCYLCKYRQFIIACL